MVKTGWNIIYDLAKEKRDEAAIAFGKANQKLEKAKKQKEQLMVLEDEYRLRALQAGQKSLSAYQWKQQQNFVENISSVLQKHEQTIQQAENEMRIALKGLQAAEQKEKGLEILIGQELDRQRLFEQKREQKEQDEWATKTFLQQKH